MEVLPVLLEIRDLLDKIERLEKAKRRGTKPKPKWRPSKYPIERWYLGTSKRYSIEKEADLIRRCQTVNKQMANRFKLPNHFRHRRVLQRGRLFIEVWRDK